MNVVKLFLNATSIPLKGKTKVPRIFIFTIQLAWVNNESYLNHVHCGAQDCAYELRQTSMDGESVVIDRGLTSPWFGFNYKQDGISAIQQEKLLARCGPHKMVLQDPKGFGDALQRTIQNMV